jgi:hypothetical protein
VNRYQSGGKKRQLIQVGKIISSIFYISKEKNKLEFNQLPRVNHP